MTVVPFELAGNKPLVQASVNGTGPYAFLVDNGSSFDVVDARVADEVGIATTGSDSLTGAGDDALAATFARASLLVGDAELGVRDVVVMPIDDAIAPAGGHHVHGLLGHPFFDRHAVELCYVGANIVLHRPGAGPRAGAAIPIEIVREHAIAHAVVVLADGRRLEGQFLVDTAARAAIALARPFAEEHDVASSFARTFHGTTGWGIGGPTRDVVGRAAALELGPLHFVEPVLTCATARRGIMAEAGLAGIIGGEILRRCHVVIDYARRELVVEPNGAFGDPFEFDRSGMFVLARGASLRELVVHDVAPGTPAAAAGIAPGDEIVGVGGTPAAELTLDAVRAIFRGELGDIARVDLLREGTPFRRELRLARLV